MGFKNTAREIAEKITEGKAQVQHLGKYTKEMIDQELFSLENEKPMHRDSKWIKKVESLKEEIMKKLSRNEDSIICQIHLRHLEWIKNQR